MHPNIPNNIVELFLNASKQHNEQIAIVSKFESINYQQLDIEMRMLAAKFSNKGIGQGDSVFVFIPMSIDLYRIILALFYIGAIPVFLDEWSSFQRLNHAAGLAKCKAMISGFKGRMLAWFLPELRRIPIKDNGALDLTLRPKTEISVTSNADTAIVTFSTGSTGKPKAAIRTHAMLFNQFTALQKYIVHDVKKPDMTALPIVLLINLGLGKTSVIPDANLRKIEEMNGSMVYAQIQKHKIASITASPFFIEQLAKFKWNNPNKIDEVEKIIVGGAPCFPSKIIQCIKSFPMADMQIVFGSTEAEPISSVGAQELVASDVSKGLLVGKSHCMSEVKIIQISKNPIIWDEDTAIGSVEMPPFRIGEIIVRGPHVLKNYLHDKEAESLNKIYMKNTLWHRTGDSGYMDEHGNIFLTGRCKELIKHKDTIISPFVFEALIQQANGVEIGTIFSFKEKLFAIIEIKKSFRKKEVEAAILHANQIIDKVLVVRKIPRDKRHYSKIDYQELRKSLKIKNLGLSF